MGFLKNTIHRAADLADAFQYQVPYIQFAPTDNGDLTGRMDAVVQDAGKTWMTQRFLIRTWIADADMSEPDAQTAFALVAGEQMYEHEANADYTVITPSGIARARMDIEVAAEKTIYVMAEFDGRVYSKSLAITGP